MLSFDQALAQLLAAAPDYRSSIIDCPLAQLAGKTLAEDLFAACDVPPQDNSAMDGFAFAFADAQQQILPVSQKVFAGMAPEPLTPGTAVRLFTGSVIPEGADTVELQENCDFDDEQVTLKQSVTQGQHVRKAGEDIQTGRQLMAAGDIVTARHLGLLASTGVASAKVFKPLRVGLLATGDELIEPGQPLASGQIYNSNLYMLQAELEAAGFEVESRHVLDDYPVLLQVLNDLAEKTDLVLSIGGVSVGDADLVKKAIESLGNLDLWKVAMKPGKPLSFGCLKPGQRTVPMLGLPGNPVSAFATYKLFALPFLRVMQGASSSHIQSNYSHYPVQLPKAMHPKREEFVRVQLQFENDQPVLVPFSHQGSGVLSSVAWATGFARIPKDQTTEPGDMVEYRPF